MDYSTDSMRNYEAGLALFARPGSRWEALEAEKGKPTFVFWGKAAGLTAEDIITDARAAGVRDRDADLRRAWDTAHPQGDRTTDWRRRIPRYAPKPKSPPAYPGFVKRLIRNGGGEADFDALMRLSPITVAGLSPKEQTRRFLCTLFAPWDKIFIFTNADGKRPVGRCGVNILTTDQILFDLPCEGSVADCDCIFKNPLTGEHGTTGEGKPSYTAKDCIAQHRYALIEFDHLPIREQAAFWLGWLRRRELAVSLAALTFSGGKSIHGLVTTGADELTAPKVQADLRALLHADPDERFRADPNGLRPHGGTRLAGATRRGNGNVQTLLYLSF